MMINKLSLTVPDHVDFIEVKERFRQYVLNLKNDGLLPQHAELSKVGQFESIAADLIKYTYVVVHHVF